MYWMNSKKHGSHKTSELGHQYSMTNSVNKIKKKDKDIKYIVIYIMYSMSLYIYLINYRKIFNGEIMI